jgi:putative DNA primase/helicase
VTGGTADFRERARRVREGIDLAALIEADGVRLQKQGHLLFGLCPFHQETTASFAVYADGGYKCHGCGAWGDAITYVAERQNVSRLRALEILEGDKAPKLATPRASTGAEKRRRYQPRMPIPDAAMAMRPTFSAWIQRAQQTLRPTAVWWYKSQGGSMLMVDARYEYAHPEDPSRTKKEVRTWCWAVDDEDGSEHWCQTRPSKDVPLYGQEQLLDRPDDLVVVCEGAKKAEAIKRWSPHIGMAWCGGCESAGKADWSVLRGRRVLLWPDYDKVGVAAATEIRGLLTAHGAILEGLIDLRTWSRLTPADEGFDAADCTSGPELLGLLERRAPALIEIERGMFAAYPGELERQALKKAQRLGLVDAPAGATPAEFIEQVKEQVADAHGLGVEEIEDAADVPPTDAEPPASSDPPAAAAGGGDEHDPDIERADIANATAFVQQHRQRVRYCADLDRWHVWNGRCWAAAEGEGDQKVPGAVMRLAEQTALRLAERHLSLARSLREEAAGLVAQSAKDGLAAAERSALLAKAELKRKAARREDVAAEGVQKRRVMTDFVLLASCRPEIAIEAGQLDRHDYFLNCMNGTVDLRDGRLYQHDPAHLITRCCAVAYDPAAASDSLQRVLMHVCNQDAEVVAYAQKILGHSIFGHNAHEQVYLWWGPGGSGKGTLMEAVKFALGDYALKAEFQSFIKTPGARVRDDLDRLKEARVVLASEVDHGEEIAAAVLKEMSGGDTIASRQLYGSYKEFRPRMTLHLQANDRPRVDDRDSGIWRRLVCIPCGPTVPADRRDPLLKIHLRDPETGAKAVLAWLVAGAVATHASKHLPMPPAVEDATRLYRQANNPIADFLRERLRLADPALAPDQRAGTWATSDAVHQELKVWYDLNNVPPRARMSPKRFRERMADWGIHYKRCERDQSNTQHYLGMTLAKYDPAVWRAHANEERHTTNTRIPDAVEHEKALQSLESSGFQVSKIPHGVVNPSCVRARTPIHEGFTGIDGNLESWKPGNEGTEEPPPDLSDPAFDPDRGAKP